MANQKINLPWKVGSIAGLIITIIVLVILWKSISVKINSGEAGVLYRQFGGGVDTEHTYGEGFHFLAPWNEMIIYDVRQHEVFEKMAVLSSNGLEINIDASCWYRPNEQELGLLHKTVGENYLSKIVQPAIRSASRSVIGRYTPEQIYSSKRDAIQQEIFEETKKIVDKKYIITDDVLIRDVALPPSIKAAIERKLKQEQESLEYEYRLQKAQKEAERQKIEAQGKADANQILNASLTQNVLKDKGIEATLKLADSDNSKVIVIGDSDGLPIILNDK